MLPRETSVRQLKKLRQETKGKDIGDLTTNDRLNHNTPNLQYIGNPVDTGIESWEEFSKKDSQLQTIAFKSKLVNKNMTKNNNNNMKENKILKLEDFGKPKIENNIKEELETAKKTYNQANKNLYSFSDYEKEDYLDDEIDEIDNEIDELDNDIISDEEEEENIDELTTDDDIIAEPINEEDPNIETFESFKLKEFSTKKEDQPEYTILGKEKELHSNPNFGIGAIKAQEIKKITDFNVIDPQTPKERTIGGNAGVFIDNDKVKGYINRIEGKDVYVESIDEPMIIKKFSLKDAIKIKK
jgi:hypothetical protein